MFDQTNIDHLWHGSILDNNRVKSRELSLRERDPAPSGPRPVFQCLPSSVAAQSCSARWVRKVRYATGRRHATSRRHHHCVGGGQRRDDPPSTPPYLPWQRRDQRGRQQGAAQLRLDLGACGQQVSPQHTVPRISRINSPVGRSMYSSESKALIVESKIMNK